MIDPSELTVVIPTRNRSEHVLATVAALASQSSLVEVLIVDQSDNMDERLAAVEREHAWLAVRHDEGRGLSRARNVGWQAASSRWIAFVDDDCRPERDWAVSLLAAIADHPEVAVVSGRVDEAGTPPGDYLPVTTLPVEGNVVIGGRRTRPWEIGMGVFMAVRRDVVVRLAGWDERLGAGTRPFPAAEDMDFNYRLLRAGEQAYVTATLRVVHHQWRRAEDLPALYGGYMAGWCGFAMKHVRQGDVRGGLWLWSHGVRDAVRMLASAARRRSWLRLRIAVRKLRGLAVGTAQGAARTW